MSLREATLKCYSEYITFDITSHMWYRIKCLKTYFFFRIVLRILTWCCQIEDMLYQIGAATPLIVNHLFVKSVSKNLLLRSIPRSDFSKFLTFQKNMSSKRDGENSRKTAFEESAGDGKGKIP